MSIDLRRRASASFAKRGDTSSLIAQPYIKNKKNNVIRKTLFRK
jgi:hypothetical protein